MRGPIDYTQRLIVIKAKTHWLHTTSDCHRSENPLITHQAWLSSMRGPIDYTPSLIVIKARTHWLHTTSDCHQSSRLIVMYTIMELSVCYLLLHGALPLRRTLLCCTWYTWLSFATLLISMPRARKKPQSENPVANQTTKNPIAGLIAYATTGPGNLLVTIKTH